MGLETFNTIEWNSPYQTEAYFDACQLIGFPCVKLLLNGTNYYFYQNGSNFVAWELPKTASEVVGELPANFNVYVLDEIGVYDDMDWNNRSKYSTVYSTRGDLLQKDGLGIPSSYKPRFKRSLKKSLESSLSHGIAETDNQVVQALNLFMEHPDRRDNMAFDFFQFVVWRWLLANVVDVHVVMDNSEKPQILGSAVTLKTSTQTNLRFYTSERVSNNPGHFLHHSLLSYYLEKTNLQLVDQSGITTPQEIDLGLRGITEFKLQTTNKTVRFEKFP